MKLSERQQADIGSIRYFIPRCLRHVPIIDQDIEAFLAKSERGIGPDISLMYEETGYQALMQGKRWREWHMRAWEEANLEGTFPYYTLLSELPRSVVDYMKKSMFGGQDAELIERVYNTGAC